VLDPFMGSGTSVLVAHRMKRHSIGIDLIPEYVERVKQQLQPEKQLQPGKPLQRGKQLEPEKQ
jgi:site-specific DNA-methyltransferase (adenine-specific)